MFGASGNVGWGAAQAFLAKGARVIVPTRSAKQAASLPAALGAPERTFAPQLDVSTPEGAAELATYVRERFGACQHVFASMGPWWQGGPIVEQDADEYRKVMRNSLDCQVFAAQALLPGMRDSGGASYTIVTGAGGQATIPGTGLLVIAVSGVFGLSRMLRAEHARDAVRINELLIHARIERAARPGVIPAQQFGEAAVALAESEIRGQVLRYDDPIRFAAALDG